MRVATDPARGQRPYPCPSYAASASPAACRALSASPTGETMRPSRPSRSASRFSEDGSGVRSVIRRPPSANSSALSCG